MRELYPSRVGRPRVLVVEDEARMRELLMDVLPEMGYEPVGVRTAEEGLAAMRGWGVNIVMLDLNLPVMDGMSFLDRFRCDWPRIPVVIMTGFGDLGSAQRAIRHGVVDFLSKPCHLGEIEAALARAAQRVERLEPAAVTSQDPAHEREDPDDLSDLDDAGGAVRVPVPTTLSRAQRLLIDSALSRHNGNRSAAAIELGISRRTLYNLLAGYRRGGDGGG